MPQASADGFQQIGRAYQEAKTKLCDNDMRAVLLQLVWHWIAQLRECGSA